MQIEDIDFHDLPINRIKLDFEKGQLMIELAVFNEKQKDYDRIELQFSGISNLSFNGEIGEVDDTAEIYGLDIKNYPEAVEYQFKMFFGVDHSFYTELIFKARRLVFL
ncbi:MAG: hypothetical protein ACWA41_06510 [Putridiphycobacter sp.]